MLHQCCLIHWLLPCCAGTGSEAFVEYANNELLRITGDLHLCPASALLSQRLHLPAQIRTLFWGFCSLHTP